MSQTKEQKLRYQRRSSIKCLMQDINEIRREIDSIYSNLSKPIDINQEWRGLGRICCLKSHEEKKLKKIKDKCVFDGELDNKFYQTFMKKL